MTYMLLLSCALKLVEEIILYYDARSKKHQKKICILSTTKSLRLFIVMVVKRMGAQQEETLLSELGILYRPYLLSRVTQETLEEVRIASLQTEIRTLALLNTKQQCPFQHIVGLEGRWNIRIFKLWRVSKVCGMQPIQKRLLILTHSLP